jgi:hypothetical protein
MDGAIGGVKRGGQMIELGPRPATGRPVLRVDVMPNGRLDVEKTDEAPTVVEEWHDLLLRSRASVSLAPRQRPVARQER